VNVDLSELVRIGGLNLLSIDDKTKNVVGAFCSEGFFNGIASIMLARKFSPFASIFASWITSIDTPYVNIGEVGELLERLFIIEAWSKSKRTGLIKHLEEHIKETNLKEVIYGERDGDQDNEMAQERKKDLVKPYCEMIFQPIALEDFLEAFAGPDAARAYMNECPQLKGSFVAFNHFTMLGESSVRDTPYTVMANYLAYGAAMVPKPDTKGVDLMIPLVLRECEESPEETVVGLSISEIENTVREGLEPMHRTESKEKVSILELQQKIKEKVAEMANQKLEGPSDLIHRMEDTTIENFDDLEMNTIVSKKFKKSGLSFIYIQVKFGKTYQSKLPAPGHVGSSSPHVAFENYFGDRKPNVPYCYIYHHLCSEDMSFRVAKYDEQRAANPPYHFPCLALCGTSTKDTSLKDLMDELSKSHAPSSNPHHPLRRTWAAHPSNIRIEDVGRVVEYDSPPSV
jgi:hypothetical protein